MKKIWISFLLTFLLLSACREGAQNEKSRTEIPQDEAFHAGKKDSTLQKSNNKDFDLHESQVEGTKEEKVGLPELRNQKIQGTLSSVKQFFWIHTNADTLIRGKNGTQIRIPKGSFVTRENSVLENEEVKVSLIECYKPSDMMISGLTTQCGNSILETSGMVHLSATCKEKEVKLGKGKSLQISFSDLKDRNDNLLFYGAKKNGIVEWEIPDSSKNSPEPEEALSGIFNDLPSFKGDLDAYLRNTLFFPESLKSPFPKGMLYASFEITPFGNIKSVQLEGRIHPLMDKLIYHAILNMPNWKPAMAGNIPIRSYYRLPVNSGKFRVPKTKIEIERAADIERKAADLNVSYDEVGASKYNSKSFGQGSLIPTGKSSELDGVVFELERMGWINCDRYYNFQKPLISYTVDSEGLENFNFFLLVKTMKGIVGPRFLQKAIVFNRVPEHADCLLVGYEILENSANFLCQDVSVSTRTFQPQKPRNLTIPDLKKELNRINGIWN